MGANATLSRTTLTVAPGAPVSLEVKVANTGTIVDEFALSVVGKARAWATVTPKKLSIFPGETQTATVTFTVPKSFDVETGAVAFAVKVSATQDPQGSVVEEGTLEIGGFADTFAELVPRTASGRTAARFRIAVDNRGNARVNADASAADPNQALKYTFRPPAIAVEPGTAGFGTVVVKPVKRFWRGQPVTHTFRVTLQSEGTPAVTADGSFLQEPLLPSWLGKAALALAALALLLGIVWLSLLRPAAKKAGKQAAKTELAKLPGGATTPTRPGGTGTTGDGDGGGQDTGTSTNLGTPVDRRLNGPDAEFRIDRNKVFSLTDIVFENPTGCVGALEIRRDNAILLSLDMANFRDLDYHFVAPIVFGGDRRVVLHAACPAASAYLAGFIRTR